jgi:hypothetical protein
MALKLLFVTFGSATVTKEPSQHFLKQKIQEKVCVLEIGRFEQLCEDNRLYNTITGFDPIDPVFP